MTHQTRGAGHTTRQMRAAPQKAVFVWVNHHLMYPKDLARKIGREDIEIVSPAWLSDLRWVGREFSGIILDHAASLTARQWEALHEVRAFRVRKASESQS